MTASFVSPGWVNFNVNFIDFRFLPVPFSNEDAAANSVHMTAGIWYYTICVYHFKRRSDGYYDIYPETEKKCITRQNTFDFEKRLSDGKCVLQRNLMLEIQIISSIGIVCAVLGFIGSIIYRRRGGEYRWAGQLTRNSLFIAGGTYTAAIVKTAMATPNSPPVFYGGMVFESVQFYCPWGLILGGIGCFFTLMSAIGQMVILIKHKTKNDVHDYQMFKDTNQRIPLQYSYPIIAPPGYHETFGLKAPHVDEKIKDGTRCLGNPCN